MERPEGLVHPLKVFDLAKSRGRLLHACAPMVRYGKAGLRNPANLATGKDELAFRQTVYSYGVDLCWTPMILAKEFNRSNIARDSDLTISTSGPQPPTIVQFGSNSALEFSRASSLVAPFVRGVDLNCGCPQSWACAETLGAALMERRELVRDMVVEARTKLRRDGWDVGMDKDMSSAKGRSISVKIRVHADLRRTMDYLDTVIGHPQDRQIDFLTIHPRTRSTPSTTPINVDALEILTSKYGATLPILLSGDAFTLNDLPIPASLLPKPAHAEEAPFPPNAGNQTNGYHHPTHSTPAAGTCMPKLAGVMSARGLLANPALFTGATACTWEVVERFLYHAARAPIPYRVVQHHISEMCAPGPGADKATLLNKRERKALIACENFCDLVDFLDERIREKRGGGVGLRRELPTGLVYGGGHMKVAC